MNRRKFIKESAFISGVLTLSPFFIFANNRQPENLTRNKKAKNIIFMISDGMSSGTLSMADLYSRNILGQSSTWMQLYHDNKISRALMDTASANSIVTDSAAASSAFGGGKRVKNGVLNVGSNGEQYLPIWQKFKKAGKKTGCVTTVTITHATPAGFCVNSSSRNAQPEIAEKYADIGFDVLMGGGTEFFDKNLRHDKKNIQLKYKEEGYQILTKRQDFEQLDKKKKLLGIFSEGALPYSIDRKQNKELQDTPTLAEMTITAINQMKNHKQGFVLQVEGGKVDWAAHANDIAALLHDQLAFDEAVKAAIEFAENDGNTLVIITTDHANANPGTIYHPDAIGRFNSISKYKYTNEYILNQINADFNIRQLKDWIQETNEIGLTDEEARHLMSYYQTLEKHEEGLYNYKKLPFETFSQIQKNHNGVGWISMDHSGDYVELAMYGPGSHLLKPFVKNTELHQLMLLATETVDNF